MPVSWLLLHTAGLLLVQTQTAKPKTMTLAGSVRIIYQSADWNRQAGKYSFSDGVIIDYDLDRIQADHVDLDVPNQHGVAKGHVRLDDPIATVRADQLDLWWASDGKHGHADNADIHLGSTHLRASSVDISAELWVIHDVEITTSIANPPWYEVHSPLMTVYPGRKGTLHKPTLYLLGHRIATIPDRSFNLDKRTEGLTIPGFNYDRQYGLGVSWGGGFLINHRTDVVFSVGVFPNSRPGYGMTVSESLLPDAKPTTFITPPSDFGERFSYGFLDDVAVTSPEGEDRVLRSPQKTISVDTVWNQELFDRNTSAAFSKPAEGVYELGGQLGGFGYISQARLQEIDELHYPMTSRFELVQDVGPPAVEIAKNLRTISRIDSMAFIGPSDYLWVRGLAGLAYKPIKQLRLSGGGYYSRDGGNPQYLIDPLYSKTGYEVRVDLLLGPTKISLLKKYDDSMKWFDKEYTVSQVVGCFEPYILYRENPSDYQLGLRLRLDNLTDLMTQRNFKRPPTVTTVISPGPDGKP